MASHAAGYGVTAPNPHFELIPLMAPGHLMPMVDMAKLLAERGVLATVVTTPLNAARIQATIYRMKASALPVHFLSLRFPFSEFGLPEGCEEVDAVPSREHYKAFLDACASLRDPLLLHLREHPLAASCIISDICHPWTRDVARELGVPRLIFHGFGCFALLCRHNIDLHKIHEKIANEDEPFVVPDLPHRIVITRAQTLENITGLGMDKFREDVIEAEMTSDGIVVNSFDDLEPSYSDFYQMAIGKKAWTIGPLSLCNKETTQMAARGRKASIDENRCLNWLNSMKPRSVVYVCFGSLTRMMPAQLIEIGLGLEASNHPFIWVIKTSGESSEVEEWLAGGFEERTSARGLIIRGWAPQVLILSHPSVGGFMTHCGWNSTVEGVSAGVPMITWPQFAEQFFNERLIVDVLNVGVAIGVKARIKWGTQATEVTVRKDDVEKALVRLMDAEEEGEERRKRAKELGEKARESMGEGGSSYMNLTALIQDVHGNQQLKKSST